MVKNLEFSRRKMRFLKGLKMGISTWTFKSPGLKWAQDILRFTSDNTYVGQSHPYGIVMVSSRQKIQSRCPHLWHLCIWGLMEAQCKIIIIYYWAVSFSFLPEPSAMQCEHRAHASWGSLLSCKCWTRFDGTKSKFRIIFINEKCTRRWMSADCYFISCIIFKFLLFSFNCACVSAHLSAGTQGGQQRAPEPLELQLQALVSHPTWCWTSNSGPWQSIGALNHRAILPAPWLYAVLLSYLPSYNQNYSTLFAHIHEIPSIPVSLVVLQVLVYLEVLGFLLAPNEQEFSVFRFSLHGSHT